jgi:hypothetical protein
METEYEKAARTGDGCANSMSCDVPSLQKTACRLLIERAISGACHYWRAGRHADGCSSAGARARETAGRISCGYNLKQIGLALHTHHDQVGSANDLYIAMWNWQNKTVIAFPD